MAPSRTQQTTRALLRAVILAGALSATAACGDIEPEIIYDEQGSLTTRAQDLSAMCTVNVGGAAGSVATESDYIPRVIACENGNAPLEALKAQAIAARTFAKFKMDIERSSVPDSQFGQVYTCGRNPDPIHYQAARETAGLVLTHEGRITVGFYVSGARPTTSSCIPSASDKARASSTDRRVENYVTYNSGKRGNGITPAGPPMGFPGNPHNRGVKSQNGATCLANKGVSASGILRFYYGDDIRLTQLGGSCGGADIPGDGPVTGPPTTSPRPVPRPGPGTPDPNQNGSCFDASTAPTLQPRSAWSARPPRSNRSRHTPSLISIHHTLQSTNASGPSAVRQLQNWHMDGNGWADIGYHYVITRDGTIWEANPVNRVGAHVRGQNTGNIGIALVGDYDSEQPSEAMTRAAARLVRYLSDTYSMPLDRNTVKSHVERRPSRHPGRNLPVDRIVDMAGASVTCDPNAPSGPGAQGQGEVPFTYELPEIDVSQNGTQFSYVRLTNVDPQGRDFYVDSVFHDVGTTRTSAASVVSSAGVSNASAALGEKDTETCEQRSANSATIGGGGELVLEFDTTFGWNATLSVSDRKNTTLPGDCESNDSRVSVEVSADGVDWELLRDSLPTNSVFKVTPETMEFVEPAADTAPRNATFTVDASSKIVRVEYYAEQVKIGESSDVDDGFTIEYRFNQTGRRLISAYGYNERGEAISQIEKFVTVGDGMTFITPQENLEYTPSIALQVEASPDIVRVSYEADGGFMLGESTDTASNFRVEYTFNMLGDRKVTARGYDASGNLVDEISVEFKVSNMGSGFRFAYPLNQQSYKPTLNMLMEVSDPTITRVEYLADGMFRIGESSDVASQFAQAYTFTQYGWRNLTARGYDGGGNLVDETTIRVLITQPDGTVPPGAMNTPPPAETSAGDVDMSRAERLAAAAFAYGGGRRSQGYCWRGVKTAAQNAGISDGYNWPALQRQGPCSEYSFALSAYCFKRQADANPNTLRSSYGMQRLSVPPSQAPRGSIIAWDRGCAGFNSTHGHIEVAQGDGTACSDYCGRIRSGGATCASVYVPVQ